MKHLAKVAFRMLAFAVLLTVASAAKAQDPSAVPTPDNTKVNQRDQDKSQPNADQQKDNLSDRNITRQIRQAVVKDKSLSAYAHNIKIISQNGMVTLKGPVRSEEEKAAIESKAADIAGKDKVTNQMEVEPKQ